MFFFLNYKTENNSLYIMRNGDLFHSENGIVYKNGKYFVGEKSNRLANFSFSCFVCNARIYLYNGINILSTDYRIYVTKNYIVVRDGENSKIYDKEYKFLYKIKENFCIIREKDKLLILRKDSKIYSYNLKNNEFECEDGLNYVVYKTIRVIEKFKYSVYRRKIVCKYIPRETRCLKNEKEHIFF